METYKIAVSRHKLLSKIPPGDPIWPKFNASFDNLELDINYVMDTVIDGQAITTHHKNNWRAADNYICGQHIGLDFDTEDERSSIKTLAKDKFIEKYASVIHTTMSHRSDAPRARVLFLLDDPIWQAKNYAMAATSLLWLFGAADRQCKDAARFFYGAPDCEMKIIAKTLPIDVVKKIIASYQSSGMAERRKANKNKYNAPATQQEVADALKSIDPWGIQYDEWVNVLMGIHAEFGEAGYALAEAWADGKKNEVADKWKSFKPHGNTAGRVTIATVFKMAKDNGWRKSSDNEI